MLSNYGTFQLIDKSRKKQEDGLYDEISNELGKGLTVKKRYFIDSGIREEQHRGYCSSFYSNSINDVFYKPERNHYDGSTASDQ